MAPLWALAQAEDLQMACYKEGGSYRRHSDSQHLSRRILTAIYYPNGSWKSRDGGELRLHLHAGATHDVAPVADRLVLMLSKVEHEVLPVTQGVGGGTAEGGGQRQTVSRWPRTQKRLVPLGSASRTAGV